MSGKYQNARFSPNGGGYHNNAPYNQNYQGRELRNNKETFKSSGATFTGDKNGEIFIYGWNASKKGGLVSFVANPISDKGIATMNKYRKEWGKEEISREYKKGSKMRIRMLVTLTQKEDIRQTVTKHTGLYDPTTERLYIPRIGMMATKNGYGRTRNGKNVSGAFFRIKSR
jgi:hypothetical protein